MYEITIPLYTFECLLKAAIILGMVFSFMLGFLAITIKKIIQIIKDKKKNGNR